MTTPHTFAAGDRVRIRQAGPALTIKRPDGHDDKGVPVYRVTDGKTVARVRQSDLTATRSTIDAMVAAFAAEIDATFDTATRG